MKIYIKIFVCSFVFNYIVIALVPTELPVVRRHKLSIYLPVQSGNGHDKAAPHQTPAHVTCGGMRIHFNFLPPSTFHKSYTVDICV